MRIFSLIIVISVTLVWTPHTSAQTIFSSNIIGENYCKTKVDLNWSSKVNNRKRIELYLRLIDSLHKNLELKNMSIMSIDVEKFETLHIFGAKPCSNTFNEVKKVFDEEVIIKNTDHIASFDVGHDDILRIIDDELWSNLSIDEKLLKITNNNDDQHCRLQFSIETLAPLNADVFPIIAGYFNHNDVYNTFQLPIFASGMDFEIDKHFSEFTQQLNVVHESLRFFYVLYNGCDVKEEIFNALFALFQEKNSILKPYKIKFEKPTFTNDQLTYTNQ